MPSFEVWSNDTLRLTDVEFYDYLQLMVKLRIRNINVKVIP